jgi:hypothetical protein
MKLDKNKTGLVLGVFFAIVHLVWALFIAIIPSLMQNFIDWIMGLHFLGIAITVLPFSILSAAMLVIMTFIVGFVFGWVFAFAWNLLIKK